MIIARRALVGFFLGWAPILLQPTFARAEPLSRPTQGPGDLLSGPSTQCGGDAELFIGAQASYRMSTVSSGTITSDTERRSIDYSLVPTGSVLSSIRTRIRTGSGLYGDGRYRETHTETVKVEIVANGRTQKSGERVILSPRWAEDSNNEWVVVGQNRTIVKMSEEEVNSRYEEDLTQVLLQAVGSFQQNDGKTIHSHQFKKLTLHYLPQRRSFLKQPDLLIDGSVSCRKPVDDTYPPAEDMKTLDTWFIRAQPIRPGGSFDLPILKCELGKPYVFAVKVTARSELGRLFAGLSQINFDHGLLGFRFRDQLNGARQCLNPAINMTSP